jgi:hypothetical protein
VKDARHSRARRGGRFRTSGSSNGGGRRALHEAREADAGAEARTKIEEAPPAYRSVNTRGRRQRPERESPGRRGWLR